MITLFFLQHANLVPTKSFSLLVHRETLTYVYWSIIKSVIKDLDEQPAEEVHRVAFGRALWTEASVPVELGCALAEGCIHQPEAL